MKLNTQEWKPFKVGKIFSLFNGKGITKQEIAENEGDFAAVQSAEDNNGVMGKIDLNYCKSMNYTYSEKPCLTVARTGSAGFVSYQANGCVVGDSAKILLLPENVAIESHYLFLQAILTANRFKYDYGRKVTEDNYLNAFISLPVQHNADGSVYIDLSYNYSDEGYVPDWQFMEDYIDFLQSKLFTTKNKRGQAPIINASKWKHFYLKDICDISMGNKMDAKNMTSNSPEYCFVGRSADNNGVAMKVDAVFNEKEELIQPYPAGSITVALGGSLGSTFLQTEPFYTSQNVSVLQFPKNVSNYAKIFLCTLIQNESLYKYCPFGRELNTHIRKDFGFKLPADSDGNPDWQFMEDYIKSLPYGDRI